MSPKIYVASLTDYNAGTLHGAWIDAAQDVDAILSEISSMLDESPEKKATGCIAEEFAIHDYEDFGDIKLSEFESIDNVAELAQLIEEHGDAYSAYASNAGMEYATAEGFEEAFVGEFDDVEDYARGYIDDTGMLQDVPDTIAQYFDYEAFARDLVLGGDIWTADNGSGIYVFNGNV